MGGGRASVDNLVGDDVSVQVKVRLLGEAWRVSVVWAKIQLEKDTWRQKGLEERTWFLGYATRCPVMT